MKKSQIWLIAGAVIVALVLVVTFYTGEEGGGEAGELSGDFNWRAFEGTELSFMTLEHPITDGVRELLSAFEEETGIKVTINAMAEDLYFDRMNIALRTDNVDVYMVPMDGDSYIQQSTGLSQSLSPFLDNPTLTEDSYDFADFPPGIMELVRYEDGYYAIPASLETYILMYNKEHVNKYLDGEVPTTMEELIAAANKISEMSKGKVSGAVMRGIRSDTLKDTITGLVYNAVGDGGYKNASDMYFTSPNDFATFRADDPDIQRGITRYAQLMKAGPNNVQSMDWPEASRAFELGKAAFFIDANLFAPGFEKGDLKGNIGYATLPIDNDEGVSYSGFWGWGYGISKNSTSPEAAWLLIQWLSNKKHDPEIAIYHGSPVRNSTWQVSEFTSTLPETYIEASKAQMAQSRSSVIRSEKEKNFYLIIVDAIQDMYSGTSVEEAMKTAKKKAERL